MAFRRAFNSRAEPTQCLALHPHAKTGQSVDLPHQGYWADGVTTQKIFAANGKSNVYAKLVLSESLSQVMKSTN